MDLPETVRLLELFGFTTVAAVSFLRWRRLRTEAAGWVTATFLVLGAVVVAGRFLPDSADGDPGGAALARALVILLAVFPYCLFRVGAAFADVVRRTDLAARIATAVLMLATAALPGFPAEGDPGRWWFRSFTLWFAVHWTVLSTLAVRRLWRAGSGQPSVVRHRMRMLAAASVALNAAVIVAAGSGSAESSSLRLVTQLLGLASAGLFLVAFSPPRSLRTVWRREELERLRLAEADLMLADTAAGVAAIVLCQAATLLGGRSAVLTDADGAVLFHHGAGKEGAAALARQAALADEGERTPPSSSPSPCAGAVSSSRQRRPRRCSGATRW